MSNDCGTPNLLINGAGRVLPFRNGSMKKLLLSKLPTHREFETYIIESSIGPRRNIGTLNGGPARQPVSGARSDLALFFTLFTLDLACLKK